MCDGYNAAGEDDHPGLEDEFLCEYVDGTMDPVVREVFEEYVRANPALEDHIECLRNTRLLLCRYGCRCHAPRDLHDRLRREITCDLVNGRLPFHILVADRLKGVATSSSAVALLLVVGILGGLTAVELGDAAPSMASAAVITAHDLRAADARAVSVRDPEPVSLMRAPRLTPRGRLHALMHAERSLVASRIQKELGARPAFAAALDHPPAFP